MPSDKAVWLPLSRQKSSSTLKLLWEYARGAWQYGRRQNPPMYDRVNLIPFGKLNDFFSKDFK